MARYQHFEELPAWQEAATLYNNVLDLIEFPNCPVPTGCRTQLDRTALAVGSHIAAGFEGFGTHQLLYHLDAAREAATEIRSLLAITFDRPRFKPASEIIQRIRISTESCSKQLTAWVAAIEKGPSPNRRSVSEDSPSDFESTEPPRRPDQRPQPSQMESLDRGRSAASSATPVNPPRPTSRSEAIRSIRPPGGA